MTRIGNPSSRPEGDESNEKAEETSVTAVNSCASQENQARAAYEAEDFTTARTLMIEASRHPEADASTFHNLGLILAECGDYQGAIDAYTRSLPQIPEGFVNRGLCWEYLGDAAAARRDYLAALEVDSDHVEALVNLGTLEREEGRVEEAETMLLRAVSLDPTCNWQLADVYIDQGDFIEAMSALERAVAAGETRAVAHLRELRRRHRTRAVEVSPGGRTSVPSERARRGGRRTSEADEYVQLVRRVRADDSPSGSRYCTVSGVHLSDDDVRDVRCAADAGEALFVLAVSVWNLPGGQLEAIEIFRSAAAHGSRDAAKALGDALNWMGAYEEAIVVLADVCRLHPDDLESAGLLGLSLHALQRYDDAEPHLRRGLALDADLTLPLAEIVRARGDLREYSELIAAAVAAEVFGSHILLGNLRSECGDDEAAIRYYRKGIASGDAHSAFNLALVLYERGDFEESWMTFRLARSLGDVTASPFDDEDEGEEE